MTEKNIEAASRPEIKFLWNGKEVTVWPSEKMEGDGDPWCWSCGQCQWNKHAPATCLVDGSKLDYYDGPLRTKACYEVEKTEGRPQGVLNPLPLSSPGELPPVTSTLPNPERSL